LDRASLSFSQHPPCDNPWASACFDRSRCIGADGTQRCSIYVHDYDCTNTPSQEIMARKKPLGHDGIFGSFVRSFQQLALEKGLLSDKMEDACIIAYVMTTDHRCVADTSKWNGGRNHILIDWNDHPRQADVHCCQLSVILSGFEVVVKLQPCRRAACQRHPAWAV